MRKIFYYHLLILFGLLFLSCEDKPNTLFTRLSENETGLTFRNLLKEDDKDFNIISYPYFYNGGGVAIGDINNDGLPDVLFTGNMVKNRLFLNEGNFSFKDITTLSHVAEKEGWCTGASMVDINGDGWMDIYVCRSGFSSAEYRKNLLFINNRDLTFTESAAQYGLDEAGYSTQASFFDYDRDGDLDVLVINQSIPKYSQGGIEYVQLHNQPADSVFKNKLFRNDHGHFSEVSAQAGIHSNVLTFSLGVNTSDINQDGWPDIYITNDFKEPDYYYVNNGDGTFTENLKQAFDHTSLYAMGIDVADYNNDMKPDIVVLDMFAESNHVQKMHAGGDNYTQYSYLFKQGMFPQYMKNTLQKNNGDGTFSEIAQLAGVSNTDWSWAPLLADLDNDGLKDLFVSNGYKRDNTDIEFVVYSMNQSLRMQRSGDVVNVADYISRMPGISLPNYVYKNTGNDRFENKITEWGFDHNTFSHGAAYADLDNDGDLDIITNNTDSYAGVYRNNSEIFLHNNYLKIKLSGERSNGYGIGAKVFAYAGTARFYHDQNPIRAYQSASDPILHLGLGEFKQLDSLRIIWPDQRTQLLRNINANQQLTLKIQDAKTVSDAVIKAPPLFKELYHQLDFSHSENQENDFQRQFLLPHFYSHNGPCMVKADINKDGLEDLFIGGAKGQSGAIFIQTSEQRFKALNISDIMSDSLSEDVDAVFFDADNDNDIDLYVVSGGYEFQENTSALQDRLYLNDGKGSFRRKATALPKNWTNKSCVAPTDIDGDGDIDLFIGGKVIPGKYPLHEPSKIYLNDGKGNFSDATDKYSAALATLGIVNDAVWIDLNSDGKDDLIVTGEWMALHAFILESNTLVDQSVKYFPSVGKGWWNTILAHDVDHDGDQDLVLGNYGANSQFKVDAKHPLKIYYADIDGNGSVDPIITHYIGEEAYPLVPRDDLNGQVPIMKKKFSDYKSYANATIHSILSADQLAAVQVNEATMLQSILLINEGNSFSVNELPVEAQYSPLFAIVPMDVNHDGHGDLVLAGNNIYNRIYLGRHDANHGVVLLNDGNANFASVAPAKSGLSIRHDVRSMMVSGNKLIVGINNSSVKVFKVD
jgi:hypothetical protein